MLLINTGFSSYYTHEYKGQFTNILYYFRELPVSI